MAAPADEEPLHQRVREQLLAGQPINDEDLVDLVANEVKSKREKVEGFILLDFPQNRVQWECLQKHQPQKEEPREEKRKCLDIVQSRG